MKSLTRLALLLVVAVLCFQIARAEDSEDSGASVAETGYWPVTGPIPASECYILANPGPTPTCKNFPAPANDIFANMPWSMSEYKTCVINRCNCTQAANTIAPKYEPSGMFCQPSDEWAESGLVTCNAMVDCFKFFWECVANTCWDRYLKNGFDSLEEGEQAYVQDIISHGNTIGQPFEQTDSFKSCAAIQCQAADSRKNCGLVTCVPNNTQCFQVIVPPPAPFKKDTCSNACQAALLMMALTVALIIIGITCGCCCPARMRIVEPLVKDLDALSKASSSPMVSSASDLDMDMEMENDDDGDNVQRLNDIHTSS